MLSPKTGVAHDTNTKIPSSLDSVMEDTREEENYDKEENMCDVSCKEGFERSITIYQRGKMSHTKSRLSGYKYFE